jgi:hypothetical protein
MLFIFFILDYGLHSNYPLFFRFKDGNLRCSNLEKLLPDLIDEASRSSTKPRTNKLYQIRFEHICSETAEPIRYCEAMIHAWDVDDSIVISDIDGTITKSDLGGMWNTTFRIKAGFTHTGYAHEGVCTLFQRLVSEGKCHIVYLTARPLDLIDVTRTYIHTLTQNGKSLPPGPIIT